LAVTLIPWHGLRPRAAGSGEINFRKHTIDLGPSETCAVADLNQDGKLDIISGENWYEQRSSGRREQDLSGSNISFAPWTTASITLTISATCPSTSTETVIPTW